MFAPACSVFSPKGQIDAANTADSAILITTEYIVYVQEDDNLSDMDKTTKVRTAELFRQVYEEAMKEQE